MKVRARYLFLMALVILGLGLSALAFAQDPTGAETLEANPQAPVDYVWVMICGFLVMFMQPGFAMVETGFCRAKNATNLMAKNLLDFVIGSLGFFIIGYSIMKGADKFGLFGTGPLFLLGGQYDVGKYLDFFWQLVFCATAATIVSGAVAERLKFSAYLIYSTCLSLFIYPIYGHWVWGGGWLSQLPFGMGHLDFAGSGVVHTIGGMVGLAGAIVLGPRFGKFAKDGKPKAIPGHSMTLAALGAFILWFGWFGFNPGSTFNAHHLRISVIAVNTNLAAAAGALMALITVFLKTKKWDVGMALNGVLAGLVAITAPCAWVEAWAAVVIGLVAGLVVVLGVYGLERLGIDDPVGAVSVHGFNGIWGLISVGLFADGTYGNYAITEPFARGLFYGGGAGQLIAQLIGAATAAIWAFVMGYIMFKIMDSIFGIRVSPEEELKGLDILEHGTPAYPNFYTINS
ncbi:ammonium transporter [Desulfoglaeba alkanexedens]|uniref:Ammonium transporter n=1 Tax=Desulfoglaeba alkanexedens ALDC TaxID=980445 RepID=A0A4P8L0Z3_9BACT|nr:ammonium transporter [Desulfoglaeba alkanexedens]QCQ21410.1 ammonium transporter [Desulfoglaeba alkanexedens ALDC]